MLEFLNQKISEFFARIEQRVSEQTRLKESPAPLVDLVTKAHLLKSYQYVLRKKDQIRNRITKTDQGVVFAAPVRISKKIALEDTPVKRGNMLARTMNIVADKNWNIQLLLETKSKKIRKTMSQSTYKDKAHTLKVGGTYKSGKISWQIDGKNPTAWMNMTVKNRDKDDYAAALQEARISRQLVLSAEAEGFTGKNQLFNEQSIGETFTKNKKEKFGLYGLKATCDLSQAIKDNVSFTIADKHNFTLNLLHAVRIMHKEGIIHQDLRPANILLYQDENGSYSVKVTDFGTAFYKDSPNKVSLGTVGYDSPEIRIAHQLTKTNFSQYYNEKKCQHFSYSKIAKTSLLISAEMKQEFLKPHMSNDVWALGCLLYEIYFGHMQTHTNETIRENIQKNPLLRGMIVPQREKRMTIEQAIVLVQSYALHAPPSSTGENSVSQLIPHSVGPVFAPITNFPDMPKPCVPAILPRLDQFLNFSNTINQPPQQPPHLALPVIDRQAPGIWPKYASQTTGAPIPTKTEFDDADIDAFLTTPYKLCKSKAD